MSFRENLCRLMEENNTSNLSLSKAIGVSDMAVARWRKGETVPSLDNAIGVANFYKISLDELAGIKQKVESHFYKVPVLGETWSGLIRIYGLPKGEYVYTNSAELDEYDPAECYCLKYKDNLKVKYMFIHQQKQCENGDYVIYQQMDSITESGLSVDMYSIRKFVRAGGNIELQPLTPNEKTFTFRKQSINLINVQGVVINKDVTH